MSQYKVLVDDNFHYMDEGERWELGTFETLAAAEAACRDLVEKSVRSEYRPGMNADELFNRYQSFGDDPFIVSVTPTEKIGFSARQYAKQLCADLCRNPGVD